MEDRLALLPENSMYPVDIANMIDRQFAADNCLQDMGYTQSDQSSWLRYQPHKAYSSKLHSMAHMCLPDTADSPIDRADLDRSPVDRADRGHYLDYRHIYRCRRLDSVWLPGHLHMSQSDTGHKSSAQSEFEWYLDYMAHSRSVRSRWQTCPPNMADRPPVQCWHSSGQAGRPDSPLQMKHPDRCRLDNLDSAEGPSDWHRCPHDRQHRRSVG
jgi:hypothetical protein